VAAVGLDHELSVKSPGNRREIIVNRREFGVNSA